MKPLIEISIEHYESLLEYAEEPPKPPPDEDEPNPPIKEPPTEEPPVKEPPPKNRQSSLLIEYPLGARRRIAQ